MCLHISDSNIFAFLIATQAGKHPKTKQETFPNCDSPEWRDVTKTVVRECFLVRDTITGDCILYLDILLLSKAVFFISILSI